LIKQTFNIKFQSHIYVLLDTNDIQLSDRIISDIGYRIFSRYPVYSYWELQRSFQLPRFSDNRCVMVTKILCRILYRLVLPVVSNTYLEYYKYTYSVKMFEIFTLILKQIFQEYFLYLFNHTFQQYFISEIHSFHRIFFVFKIYDVSLPSPEYIISVLFHIKLSEKHMNNQKLLSIENYCN